MNEAYLFRLNGLSWAEIGELLNISPNTIRKEIMKEVEDERN